MRRALVYFHANIGLGSRAGFQRCGWSFNEGQIGSRRGGELNEPYLNALTQIALAVASLGIL